MRVPLLVGLASDNDVLDEVFAAAAAAAARILELLVNILAAVAHLDNLLKCELEEVKYGNAENNFPIE